MAKKIPLWKTCVYELDTNDIIDYVEKLVLQYHGKGFDVQIFPEITINKKFNGHVHLFSKKYSYRPAVFIGTEYASSEQILSTDLCIEYNAVIAKGAESKLPAGITIKKSAPTVLLDERIKEDWKPNMSFDHEGANYAEGRRVYISVSDDYAAKVFKETYETPGVKFKNVLLTKYKDIILEMTSLIQQFYTSQFFVDDNYVGWSSGIACKTSRYINTNHYDIGEAISFDKFEMKPLESLGQKYGMILAIIEMLKNSNPKYKNADYRMLYGFYCCGNSKCIKVDIQFLQEVKVETPKILNDW